MHIFKKIIRGLGAYGFRAALFGGAFSIAFVLVFGTPESLKTAINDSGLYEVPLTDLITAEQQQESSELELSVDDPIVQESVATAFPPERKQEIVETILDGTYVWLNEDTEYPDFTIDISDEKAMIIASIADSTFEEVNSLQPCTLLQLQTLSGSEFDPLNAPCKPPIDLTAEKQKFISEYSSNDEFLSDTTLTGEELFKEGERHDSTNGANNIPSLFGLFTRLPFILGVITLITGLGVVLLSETRRKGVRKLGKLLVETAISLVIVGVALFFVLGGIKAGLGSQGPQAIQPSTHSIIESLRGDIMLPAIIITALYLLVGIVLLLLTRKKDVSQEHVEPQTPKPEQTP